MKCSKCNFENLETNQFCGKCGERLETTPKTGEGDPVVTGERKQATVLFSDISGYTSMLEKLDPEEVHTLMNQIFGEATRIMAKYEGHIYKLIGDAVMVLFGFPQVHEDDAVRAIKAAQELHKFAKGLSPLFERKIGRAIATHSGISTGLVVAYDINNEEEKERVLGDTINLASRLTGLAKEGEIVVNESTFKHAERFFQFEALELTSVKGKEQPIQAYKVIALKEKPVTVHRLSGIRANLIGRDKEINILKEATRKLIENREGSIITISGDAGIGKSRLVEEFKASLGSERIEWLEGHSYAYSQNIPYYLLVDLLNRAFDIKEDEHPENTKVKLGDSLKTMDCDNKEITPYIGNLYGLKYLETENIDPDLWKYRIYGAVNKILSALVKKKPTIVFLEDLQWADPSSADLFRSIMTELKSFALFVCVYRPYFVLFTDQELTEFDGGYCEIHIEDLSSFEAEEMTCALLKTDKIPLELGRFMREKAEGNPFYLEEVINSLIESDTLVPENGNWKLTRPISDVNIPPTIEGVISARLDRLEKEMKRLIQEASAIGRVFLYKILYKITEMKEHIDTYLTGLESYDLIRIRSLGPDLEYIFKHALTQDVAHNGILKKERQRIHKRISLVIEELFSDRLSEFYEALAYHYKQTDSVYKAVDYLIKSGDKAINRFATEEAHQYYQDAYKLLTGITNRTNEDAALIIRLINQWSWIYWWLADIKSWRKLLETHIEEVDALEDKTERSIFYSWLTWVLLWRGELKEASQYADKAIKLSEDCRSTLAIGLSCNVLAWLSVILGYVDKAVAYGERARQIANISRDTPPHILFNEMVVGSAGFSHCARGDSEELINYGKELLEAGRQRGNPGAAAYGHSLLGSGYFHKGDAETASNFYRKAIHMTAGRWYRIVSNFRLTIALIQSSNFKEAKKTVQELMEYNESAGLGILAYQADILMGIIEITEGKLNHGMTRMMKAREISLNIGDKFTYVMEEYLLGVLYLKMILDPPPKELSGLIKNIGFIFKYALFPQSKARVHLEAAIRAGGKVGMNLFVADSYLELARLNKHEKKLEEARRCLNEAIRAYEQMSADFSLKKAREVLASLK